MFEMCVCSFCLIFRTLSLIISSNIFHPSLLLSSSDTNCT
jgi:hypothetical protein